MYTNVYIYISIYIYTYDIYTLSLIIHEARYDNFMLPDETSRCDEIFLNFLADPRPAALRILQGKPLLGIDFGRVDFGFVV